MQHTIEGFLKRGYVPLSLNRYAGIGFQGELLDDFWMWNRQYGKDASGARRIQTVRVSDIKEAAIRYWRDGWVPLRPIDEEFLGRLEKALREHRGLKREGIKFSEGRFLDMPGPGLFSKEDLGPEVKRYLGTDEGDIRHDPKRRQRGREGGRPEGDGKGV